MQAYPMALVCARSMARTKAMGSLLPSSQGVLSTHGARGRGKGIFLQPCMRRATGKCSKRSPTAMEPSDSKV